MTTISSASSAIPPGHDSTSTAVDSAGKTNKSAEVPAGTLAATTGETAPTSKSSGAVSAPMLPAPTQHSARELMLLINALLKETKETQAENNLVNIGIQQQQMEAANKDSIDKIKTWLVETQAAKAAEAKEAAKSWWQRALSFVGGLILTAVAIALPIPVVNVAVAAMGVGMMADAVIGQINADRLNADPPKEPLTPVGNLLTNVISKIAYADEHKAIEAAKARGDTSEADRLQQLLDVKVAKISLVVNILCLPAVIVNPSIIGDIVKDSMLIDNQAALTEAIKNKDTVAQQEIMNKIEKAAGLASLITGIVVAVAAIAIGGYGAFAAASAGAGAGAGAAAGAAAATGAAAKSIGSMASVASILGGVSTVTATAIEIDQLIPLREEAAEARKTGGEALADASLLEALSTKAQQLLEEAMEQLEATLKEIQQNYADTSLMLADFSRLTKEIQIPPVSA